MLDCRSMGARKAAVVCDENAEQRSSHGCRTRIWAKLPANQWALDLRPMPSSACNNIGTKLF